MSVVLAGVLAFLCAWVMVSPSAVARIAVRHRYSLPRWIVASPDALPSHTRWMLGAGAAVVLMMVVWDVVGLWSLPVSGAVIVGVWVVMGKVPSAASKKRLAQARESLPEALDLMRLCMRAGQPLRVALDSAQRVMESGVSAPMQRVLDGLAVGMDEREAWEALASDRVWGAVAADVARACAWGLPLDNVLLQHSRSLRRTARAESLARAKASGVRAVLPLAVCYLPAFALVGVVPIIAGMLLKVWP